MPRKKSAPNPVEAKPEEGDDELVVLCLKVLTHPRPPVPGCSRVPCSDCGQPVWISPATAAHVADRTHRICCAECVARDAEPDMQVMAPSKGQIAEMLESDPSLTAARISRKFPASNPARRRASLDELLKRTKARKRTDN